MKEFKSLKEAQDAFDKQSAEMKTLEKLSETKDKTITGLKNDNSAALEMIEEKNKQVADLTKQVTDLNAQVDSLSIKVENLQDDMQELNDVIADARANGSSSKPTFTHTDKKQYEVTSKSFSLDGKIVTVKDVLASKELQDQLVEMEAHVSEVIESED